MGPRSCSCRCNETMKRLGIEQNQAGWVAAELHHRRHRGAQRARQPGGDRRHRAVREGVDPVRQGRGAARPAPPAEPAEAVARHGDAGRSEGSRRADDDHGEARGDLRQRQVVRGPGEARRVPEHRRHHEDHGDVARREAAAPGLGRLAHDLAADAEGLRAVRRAVEQGREGARVRRHRRDVAREVRHAARRVHEGARSAVGSGAAALSEAARVRADEAAREVRRRRAGQRARFRRTCSATSGRRTGRTSIRSSRRRTPIPATR